MEEGREGKGCELSTSSYSLSLQSRQELLSLLPGHHTCLLPLASCLLPPVSCLPDADQAARALQLLLFNFRFIDLYMLDLILLESGLMRIPVAVPRVFL